MKIAVNTRLLLKNRLEGIGIFTRETLSRITKAHPEHQFYFLFDRAYDESFIFSDNVTPVVAHPQARHPYLWYLFFEHGIPPEFVPPVVRRYYDRFFPKFARNATRLATVSQFSCDDIHQSYQVPTERIDVVYNGANQAYRPYTEEEQSAVKQHYTDGKDYFLFVGLIHKRKNLANIFRAFELFKERTGSPMKLVVVGDKKWWAGEIEDTYLAMHYRKDVVMLGRQQIDTLSALTAAATAMVYASLFEGFGQPIVDAFNAHTAVITSDVSSMPEIAGGAALLVNPYSVEEIAHAMEQLCLDENLRNTLIEKGMARKGIYTWDYTAELLWQTVEKCLP